LEAAPLFFRRQNSFLPRIDICDEKKKYIATLSDVVRPDARKEEERSEFFFTKRELIYLNNKSVKTEYAQLSYYKKVYLECFIFQHFSSSRVRVRVCVREFRSVYILHRGSTKDNVRNLNKFNKPLHITFIGIQSSLNI